MENRLVPSGSTWNGEVLEPVQRHGLVVGLIGGGLVSPMGGATVMGLSCGLALVGGSGEAITTSFGVRAAVSGHRRFGGRLGGAHSVPYGLLLLLAFEKLPEILLY